MMSRLPALSRLASLDLRGIKLGLAAIDAVCERLGRPERRVPSVLVAGTNGKGSTAATLSAIAATAGVRAGLYTSPHLVDVTERIRFGADDIAPEELDAALGEVFAAADRGPAVPVTYFEAMTAAAFVAFAQRGLELAILEVGLGGRLDATNVAPAVLSVVTSISLDHVEDLGSTVAKIAAEKAGVFRRGRPALVDSRDPEALRSFRAAAADPAGASHDAHRGDGGSRGSRTASTGTRFRLETPWRAVRLETPLPGAHQAWNAASRCAPRSFFPRSSEPFRRRPPARGLSRVRWPGRLERFRRGAGPSCSTAATTRRARRRWRRFLEEAGLSGRADLVFGAMADKDVEGIAAALSRRSEDRAGPGRSPRRRRRSPPALGAAATGRPRSAPRASRPRSKSFSPIPRETEPIIVAGSLYLVGEARALLLSGRFRARRP